MKKVLLVFGTRPEAIKMAPVLNALKKKESLITKVCSTSQHASMLDQMLDVFNIQPDFDLHVMKDGQTLSYVTAAVLEKLHTLLQKDPFDFLLVQGDTTTTFTASLAAFYLKIPVGHVEAGLRTYNPYFPWPEEMNRQLATRVSTLHFAPTHLNKQNLLNEMIDEKQIFVTGNPGIDSLIAIDQLLSNDATVRKGVENYLLERGFKISERPFVFMTSHRREHFGEDIENIFRALKTLATNHPEMNFVFPVHLNPNVSEPAHRLLKGLSNVYLLEPIDYLATVYLLRRCHLILTDSGGLQEEGPVFGKPVVVLRNETERPEGVTEGAAILVGNNFDKIVATVEELLSNATFYKTFIPRAIYGDGHASEKIADIVEKFLG